MSTMTESNGVGGLEPVRLLPVTWPEMCAPLPEQWLDWLAAHPSREQQLEIVGRVLDVSSVANRCAAHGHDGIVQELRRTAEDGASTSQALTRVAARYALLAARYKDLARAAATRATSPRRLP